MVQQTVEAHDTTARTSIRLLAVLDVFKYENCERQRRAWFAPDETSDALRWPRE